MVVLVRTLLDAYEALIAGNSPRIVKQSATYHDFVQEEQSMLQGKEGRSRLLYWKRQLVSPLPYLILPTDRPRSSAQRSPTGKTVTYRISTDLSSRIKRFSKHNNLYLYTTFLGIFKILLHKYSGQRDLVVGMPGNERNHNRFDQLVGFMINMIVIRSELLDNDSILTYLDKLQNITVDGLANSYPYSVLVRELKLTVNATNSPAFQVAFMYHDLLDSIYTEERSICILEDIHQEGEYETFLEVVEYKKHFLLNWKYEADCSMNQPLNACWAII